ncbi:MAG: A/G-specific adenine glycosylase [Bosea sp. (in: a-proteobacteria)]
MSAETKLLLAWYDRHARALPWRAMPGQLPDPYRVWLSEIMLQQTTVAAVKGYFERFLVRCPTVESLASAELETVMQLWAGLGYYSRARNLHACAKTIVSQHGGRFPDTEADLLRLPGIGPYTAAAIAAIAFNRKAAAVDGNVERVITRLRRIEEALPAAKSRIKAETLALVPDDRPGDFAQALMDLGATICTPKKPACALCPWQASCLAHTTGDMETFPRKAAKRTGMMRYGAAFVALREDGAVLLRTRPSKGLLGGMAEVPTGEWLAGVQKPSMPDHPPLKAQWQLLDQPVRHVFTHFPLDLSVFVAAFPMNTTPPEGMRFTARGKLGEEPLSTLMRKVVSAGLEALGS